MKEQFQPISNTPPAGLIGKMKFYGRMLLDLQILTIYKDVKKHLPAYKGNILDIGCGQSPYKFLLNGKDTKYFGIDIIEASEFGYHNPDITAFDGKNIPFENEKFDAVICTEVLEHVQDFQYLIDEIYRTGKKGADIIVTIPWSARYHYIPYDYFRYTPSSLKTMFKQFSTIKIKNRGTDLSVIGSKIIVLFFRGFFPRPLWKYIFLPIYLLFLPVLIISVIVAHLAIIFNLGSIDDPLGYTIVLKK
ncbi:class I SAM-dependent methyltransferase [Terrimonas alba]|uniref:class I SAM-dependent methyltransferase n=1 Tax=Terrimonas alba TaxID=3349636 RepID=UPI0035F4B5E3